MPSTGPGPPLRKPSTNSPSALRVSGFRRAMEEAGLAIDEALIYRADNRFAGIKLTGLP